MTALIQSYRKRPVVIEAALWDGTLSCAYAIREAFGPAIRVSPEDPDSGYPVRLVCATLERSDLPAAPGDWIVRGVVGEVYPVNAEVFAKTYTAVE